MQIDESRVQNLVKMCLVHVPFTDLLVSSTIHRLYLLSYFDSCKVVLVLIFFCLWFQVIRLICTSGCVHFRNLNDFQRLFRALKFDEIAVLTLLGCEMDFVI